MKITAQLQEMSVDEIKKFISPEAYSKIKATDPHPEFRSYAVGHEGQSKGRFVEFGTLIKTWFKSAIQAINDKLKIGTKVFSLHNENNSHDGRIPVGEVVGKTLEKWGDTLYSLAIIYILPQFRAINLDVASIEADIRLAMDDLSNIQIHGVDVKGITGIALGDSTKNKPGFAGATLTARLQEFTSLKKEKEGETMTIEELKAAIKAGNHSIIDLFPKSVIEENGYVKELVKDGKKNEYERGQRILEKSMEKEDGYLETIKTKDTEIKSLKSVTLKTTAKSLFTKLSDDRKLTDTQKTYIGERLDTFVPPEEADKLSEGLNAFMDKGIIELNKVSEILGLKKPDEDPDPDKKKPSMEKDDKSGDSDEYEDDYVNPDKNDFMV